MAHRLAIDFGTTNTAIAHWNETSSSAEIVSVPDETVREVVRAPAHERGRD